MEVLVTGGAGYIGSTLVRLLLERGHNVTVFDRLLFGREPLSNVEGRIKIIEGDTRKLEPSVLRGIEAVIDMAALSNDPSGELDKQKTYDINHKARARIARLAKEAGVRKYVLASSCSVYGASNDILDETSQVNPQTTYAEANILWENDALPLADKDFHVTVLRQATCYGFSYRMRFDLAINGMARGFFKDGKIPVMRDGNQWRPFVHVKDTSAAFIKVIEENSSKFNKEIFNVGANEQNYQILPLAQLVAESIGVPFSYDWYGSPDTRNYRVSFDKIKRAMGFEPRYTPKEGALEIFLALQAGSLNPDDTKTRTVDWYKHLISQGLDL